MGVGELTKGVEKFNNDNDELTNGVSELVVDNLTCQRNDREQFVFVALSKNKHRKLCICFVTLQDCLFTATSLKLLVVKNSGR